MNSVLALRLFNTHSQFLVLCIIQYAEGCKWWRKEYVRNWSVIIVEYYVPQHSSSEPEKNYKFSRSISPECVGPSKYERNYEMSRAYVLYPRAYDFPNDSSVNHWLSKGGMYVPPYTWIREIYSLNKAQPSIKFSKILTVLLCLILN
jgi:hypothetical protein